MRLLVVAFVPVVFALAPATTAPAAPVPKHLMKGPVYYHPTMVGTKWVYQSGDIESVSFISKVETIRGTKRVTIDYDSDWERPASQIVEVSETGMIAARAKWEKNGPRYVMLNAPFEVRNCWKVKQLSQPSEPEKRETEFIREIVGFERVKVPAGTFEAIVVEEYFWVGELRVPEGSKTWYAPNVGVVQVTRDDKIVCVLKSFTPGKE
jgi:hypothetical protein